MKSLPSPGNSQAVGLSSGWTWASGPYAACLHPQEQEGHLSVDPACTGDTTRASPGTAVPFSRGGSSGGPVGVCRLLPGQPVSLPPSAWHMACPALAMAVWPTASKGSMQSEAPGALAAVPEVRLWNPESHGAAGDPETDSTSLCSWSCHSDLWEFQWGCNTTVSGPGSSPVKGLGGGWYRSLHPGLCSLWLLVLSAHGCSVVLVHTASCSSCSVL